MKTKILKLIASLGIYLTLVVFLANTNPRHLALPLIIVPFVLIFMAIYLPVYFLLNGFMASISGGPTTSKRARFIALAGASLPCFLLVLSSINQLTLKDVLLWLALISGLVFYTARGNFVRR